MNEPMKAKPLATEPRMTESGPQRAVKPTDTGRRDANRDPLTDEKGAHPVGVGLGAAATGAAAGAVGGAMGGPAGAVAGAVVGGVVGGVVGKSAAEVVNPTTEETYWRTNHERMPYAGTGFEYDDYEPAYRYGWESYGNHKERDRSFESVEEDLRHGWEKAKGKSRLKWEQARHAVREAWIKLSK